MDNLIYREEAFKIVGACLDVYANKGCGFLEPVYQECLEFELELQRMDFYLTEIAGIGI